MVFDPVLKSISRSSVDRAGISRVFKLRQHPARFRKQSVSGLEVTPNHPCTRSNNARYCIERIHRTSSLLRSRSTLIQSSILTLSPTSEAPSVKLVLATVVGLPTVLWIYKCLMMVLLQRKIIYMGYVPPSARTEELGVDLKFSPGISCEEVQVEGDDNISLYGILVRRNVPKVKPPSTVLVYLQGNAGNPLGRIPIFERLLLGPMFPTRSPSSLDDTAVLAVAPRSYWKSSSRRPTERGHISDYTHVIAYAAQRFPSASIILYGHSLGGAAAVCLSAQLKAADYPNVRGLILENPFASIPGMVKALYPQRWLPYHYLGRFAFDKWDALTAMQTTSTDSLLHRLSERMLVILSGNDEIVPNSMGVSLFDSSTRRSESAGPDNVNVISKKVVLIKGALHEDAWRERKWRTSMEDYITGVQRLCQAS